MQLLFDPKDISSLTARLPDSGVTGRLIGNAPVWRPVRDIRFTEQFRSRAFQLLARLPPSILTVIERRSRTFRNGRVQWAQGSFNDLNFGVTVVGQGFET